MASAASFSQIRASGRPGAHRESCMDLREIKKLINLMNENGLNRLEVEEEGKRYLLEKGNHQIGVERAIVGLVAHPTAELQAPAAVPNSGNVPAPNVSS